MVLVLVGFVVQILATAVISFDSGEIVVVGVIAAAVVLALGALLVWRRTRARGAWIAAAAFGLALLCIGILMVNDTNRWAGTAFPFAFALGSAALASLGGGDWLPFALLAGLLQLVVLPPSDFLEATLDRTYEWLNDTHVVALVQLAVAALAVSRARMLVKTVTVHVSSEA